MTITHPAEKARLERYLASLAWRNTGRLRDLTDEERKELLATQRSPEWLAEKMGEG